MEEIKRGKFIVFEGLDGCGKTTHAKALVEFLNDKGILTEQTFEPTSGEMGKLMRRYLSGELKTSEEAIAALFVADRLDHIMKKGGLLDLLNKGINVVCDRYYLSSIAYNAPSHTPLWVYNLNKVAFEVLSPDLVIFLDMPAFREDRLDSRSSKEIYETSEYQKIVKARYEEAFALHQGRIVKISSNRDKKDVQKDVRLTVMDLFK